MALSDKDYENIKEELDTCKRPVYLFHDDADGVASFLLLYRYVKEGKGIIVKSTPKVTTMFSKKIQDYDADKVFIVDLAMVEDEFLDDMKVPVVWIDHHEPQESEKAKYFNPRKNKKEDNLPASVICYNAVKQDLWIAMIGAVGDWFLPDFAKEFSEKYPELLPKEINRPEDALFNSELGKLIKIVSFILKGNTEEVMKCVKIMTRLESPDEILKQTTSQGSYIYKRFKPLNDRYEELLKEAVETAGDEKVMLFTYKDDRISFTKDLANELLYKFPDKAIILGREKGNSMKMSIRAAKKTIPPILEKAMAGLDGYGGGHEHACGACVNVKDFDQFIERIIPDLE